MKYIIALGLSSLIMMGCDENDAGDGAQVVDERFGLTSATDNAALTFSKTSPESLIECLPSEAGDNNCRLISKSIVLMANPEGVEKTYNVSYTNTCKNAGAVSDNVDSMIRVRAQPVEEGDVAAAVYFNKSASFVIRGSADLRVEAMDHYPLPSLLEKGCGLVVQFETI